MFLLLIACGIPPSGTTRPIGDSGFWCDPKNEDCRRGTCSGEGGSMLPGSDCLACHTGGEGGRFSAAGTAFQDVGGIDSLSGAVVRITDANDTVVELDTNRVGNFYTTKSLTFPLNAEIEVNGTVLAMVTPVEVGACDSCHACSGAAGGKIYGP